jgi:hypothetical protein
MQPAEQHNVDVVLRYFDGCNTGELNDLLPTLAEDVIHYFLAETSLRMRLWLIAALGRGGSVRSSSRLRTGCPVSPSADARASRGRSEPSARRLDSQIARCRVAGPCSVQRSSSRPRRQISSTFCSALEAASLRDGGRLCRPSQTAYRVSIRGDRRCLLASHFAAAVSVVPRPAERGGFVRRDMAQRQSRTARPSVGLTSVVRRGASDAAVASLALTRSLE